MKLQKYGHYKKNYKNMVDKKIFTRNIFSLILKEVLKYVSFENCC